jgi:hypothetical protein
MGALSQSGAEQWTVAISGDTLGYLSPCGCTTPMAGGIVRRATAVRGESLLFVDNGSLTDRIGRQSEMKAETLAQALAASGVAAINLTSQDAQLGRGSVLSVARLSGNKLIATQIQDGQALGLERWQEKGPFLVGGVTLRQAAFASQLGLTGLSAEDAAVELEGEARTRSKTAVLLLEGTLADARTLATKAPDLAMIVYRVVGDPPAGPEMEGRTLLVTPGDRGRNVVKLSYEDGALGGYRVEHLGPETHADPEVKRIYKDYLLRVSRSDLLERVLRSPGEKFAGNQKCMSCHATPAAVWKRSEHAHALATLDKVGHARDPDCVSCHVVGLALSTGFQSRTRTPSLTDVGCESCHGAGASHAAKPKLSKMPKVGTLACAPCHTTENSPHFDFATYWKRIQH